MEGVRKKYKIIMIYYQKVVILPEIHLLKQVNNKIQLKLKNSSL